MKKYLSGEWRAILVVLLNALRGPEHGLVRKMLNQIDIAPVMVERGDIYIPAHALALVKEAAEIAPLADMERAYVMNVLKIIEESDGLMQP